MIHRFVNVLSCMLVITIQVNLGQKLVIERRTDQKGDRFGAVDDRNICQVHGAIPRNVNGKIYCDCPEDAQTLFSVNGNEKPSCFNFQHVCTSGLKNWKSGLSVQLVYDGTAQNLKLLSNSTCDVSNLALSKIKYWNPKDGFVQRNNTGVFQTLFIKADSISKFKILFDGSKSPVEFNGAVIKLSLLCSTNNKEECVLLKVNGTQTWIRDFALPTTTVTTTVTTKKPSTDNTLLIIAIAVSVILLVVLAVCFISRKKIQLLCSIDKRSQSPVNNNNSQKSPEIESETLSKVIFRAETPESTMKNSLPIHHTYYNVGNTAEIPKEGGFKKNESLKSPTNIYVESSHYEKLRSAQENPYQTLQFSNELK